MTRRHPLYGCGWIILMVLMGLIAAYAEALADLIVR
jgi:hypothetical protein